MVSAGMLGFGAGAILAEIAKECAMIIRITGILAHGLAMYRICKK